MNEEFGAEVDILVEEKIGDLAEVDGEVAESIRKFREDEIILIPGGGGDYGERIIPESEDEAEKVREKRKIEINCRYKERS